MLLWKVETQMSIVAFREVRTLAPLSAGSARLAVTIHRQRRMQARGFHYAKCDMTIVD